MDLTPSSKSNATLERQRLMTKLAQNHPLCITNVTVYAGQTAKMHCCLARLDRELSVRELIKQIKFLLEKDINNLQVVAILLLCSIINQLKLI